MAVKKCRTCYVPNRARGRIRTQRHALGPGGPQDFHVLSHNGEWKEVEQITMPSGTAVPKMSTLPRTTGGMEEVSELSVDAVDFAATYFDIDL